MANKLAIPDVAEDELDHEVNKEHGNEYLWNDWPSELDVNQTEHQETQVSSTGHNRETNSTTIESGEKVFYLSNCTITDFTC